MVIMYRNSSRAAVAVLFHELAVPAGTNSPYLRYTQLAARQEMKFARSQIAMNVFFAAGGHREWQKLLFLD